eukprot:NODE_3756_length_855_cov_55.241758_g3733_i0.p1 GENE.NODE_3756_length_855_cov_55.241758_g3733_i0~~NODE_3756_length_855_cov_55.241758_g3733_i0.p1  ORF type:complete len:220 (+),score=50.08 NODE_3756_length_855_cov_55.241758_g3733_i0:82-741(+)
MPFSYACVAAVQREIITSASIPGGPADADKIATQLVAKLPRHDTKVSYEQGEFTYNLQVQNKGLYIVVNPTGDQKRIAYAFLQELQDKFCASYGGGAGKYPDMETMKPHPEFKGKIMQLMKFYNENPESDKITKVKNQIDDVKGIMIQNIDSVLERGAKLETIVDKTEQLQEDAVTFKKGARTVKNEMRWKKIRLYIIIGVVLAVVIGIIIIIIVMQTK